MTDDVPASDDKNHGAIDRPASTIVAVVQCEGFRCLARREADNRWRDYHTGKELPKVIRVIFEVDL